MFFVLCVGGIKKVAELLRGWVRAGRGDACGRYSLSELGRDPGLGDGIWWNSREMRP